MTVRVERFRSFALLAFLASGCSARSLDSNDPGTTAAAVPQSEAPKPDAERLTAFVAYLAADLQEGRAPGGEADARVQEFVAKAMAESGLEPAGVDGFFQPFTLTDGVRVKPGEESVFAAGSVRIEHELVSFGHDTASSPIDARLVFVGHGIPGAETRSGDYAKADVKGAIAVALDGGPSDPHVTAVALRPQSKLIAARDRGAVGFVLWDPTRTGPCSNSGEVQDGKIPAVCVAAPGTSALLKAMNLDSVAEAKAGAKSRRPVRLGTPIEAIGLRTANVVGRLASTNPKAKLIVVGAHFDHLGRGGHGSLAADSTEIHNGADDNASGVAAILELARLFGSRPNDVELIFVAFGAEERGLLGSKHFVASRTPDTVRRSLAMLNFDMVGRLRTTLEVHGSGTAKEWKSLLSNAAGGRDLQQVEDGWGPSDHASFYGADLPVLHFFTGSHEDYHRPTDDAPGVNIAGIIEVIQIASEVIEGLAHSPTLTFVKVEKPAGAARSAFRVSLGTMPDYGAKVEGLALAGVRAGGPAASGGLRKGDVIIRIDERSISNIDDYMAALATMTPGKKSEIEVKRGEENVVLEVIPAGPSK